MEKMVLFLFSLLAFIRHVNGSDIECYHLCSDSIWCCYGGDICIGKCLSLEKLVGAIIGGLVGLVVLISCFCLFVKKNKNNQIQGGMVIQGPPLATAAAQVGGQQYGHPITGQQYGQSTFSQQFGQAMSGYSHSFGTKYSHPAVGQYN